MAALTNIVALPAVCIFVLLSLFDQDRILNEIDDTKSCGGRECSIDDPMRPSTLAIQLPEATQQKPTGGWTIIICALAGIIEIVVGLTLCCTFRCKRTIDISSQRPQVTRCPCTREATWCCNGKLECRQETAMNESTPRCCSEVLRLQDTQLCSLRDELAEARAENKRLLHRHVSLQSMCSDHHSGSDGYSEVDGSDTTVMDTSYDSMVSSESDVGGPRHGSWEWPLSKDESQLRVQMIDDRIHALDKSELAEEVSKMQHLYEIAMHELVKKTLHSTWAEEGDKKPRNSL